MKRFIWVFCLILCVSVSNINKSDKQNEKKNSCAVFFLLLSGRLAYQSTFKFPRTIKSIFCLLMRGCSFWHSQRCLDKISPNCIDSGWIELSVLLVACSEKLKHFTVSGEKITSCPIVETVESNSKSDLVSWFKGCWGVQRLNRWAEVVQSLGWTLHKVCFCSRDTHSSALLTNKLCPCCGATTPNEHQTFIYTWACVWYSRGHCGSLLTRRHHH